jgi:small subunit ribosomal protein S1
MNMETAANQSAMGQGLTEQSEQGLTTQSTPSLTKQDLDEYLTDYQAPSRGDIRTGVVLEKNERGLVVDIGSKREGLVPAEDLTRLDAEIRSGIQVGTTVRVFVLRPEDREGHPVLSIHQAHLYEDWLRAEQMMEGGELYEGEVTGYNRGGVIVMFGKIRGFVPASQIVGLPRRLRVEERRQRLEAMIGQGIGLKIIEVDRHRRRLIFSQRRALRAWQERQRERVIAQLVEGETRHGRVTDITSFGAFVDLGGADGLIHVSELSWSRVDNPRQVLKVGDELDVYILSVDRERKRIALSLKKLQPDPWTLVDDHYEKEQLVEGKVTRVLDFGAFIELDLGIEGLLHSSEMIGTPELRPADIVHPGETLLVKIIRIDSRRRRLALSARQVRQDEWEHWVARQQAAREAQESATSEAAEEETVAPETQAEIGETAEEQAPMPEATVSEATEEETAIPGVQTATGEAAEEETTTPEIVVSEATEEETAIPGVQTATGEAAEEQIPTPETHATEAYAEEPMPDAAEETASRTEVPIAVDGEETEPNEASAPDVASEAEAVS